MARWVVAYIFLILAVANDVSMTRQWNGRLRPSDETTKQKAPEHQWFDQRLDHFDPTNSKKWKQRYHVINEYYQKGGPAFLMVEGEWEATGEYMRGYAAVGYAKKLNAIVFQLEHRYYGTSWPTSDLSVENLRYLTVDQALADNVFFIESMISQYQLPEGTKWIAFGGSYSGNLAAWLRYKFPHLVYASVSYSAPVLAKLNFYEYKSYVRDIFNGYTKECVKSIKEAHRLVKAIIMESNDLSDFTKKFKLCDPIDVTNKKDVGRFFEAFGDNIDSVLQDSSWTVNVAYACDVMMNKTIGDYIDRYAELNSLMLNEDSKKCFGPNYDKYVGLMKNVSWESKAGSDGSRQWTYQSCTEVGYFQTSYKPTHFFSEDIPLDYFIQLCADIFGAQFNKQLADHGVKRTNMVYGGKNIKATKVAYVSGHFDAWFPLGITEAKPEAPTFFVEDGKHCPCLYGYNDKSPENVKSACDQIEGLVTQWCKE